ncbi:MAG: response regulator [Bdellovibrionales bacterium]|nr:response regulator [Bdellovibrionales bacterium]
MQVAKLFLEFERCFAENGGTLGLHHSKSPSRRVAVVDDSIDMRKLLVEYLSWYGLEVLSFGKVSDALDFLLSGENSVDLILCDLNFPEENGLSLIQALRSHRRNIPIVLMSAFADCATRCQLYEAGAVAYVNKTDGLAKILGTVQQSMNAPLTTEEKKLNPFQVRY